MNPFVCKKDPLEAEIEAEQVRKIDLSEYAPGQPHYERLMEAMANQTRYRWPNDLMEV